MSGGKEMIREESSELTFNSNYLERKSDVNKLLPRIDTES